MKRVDEKMTGGPDVGVSGVGQNHRRDSTITHAGLDERGNVFFAAIEMTRMPMMVARNHAQP